MTRLSWSQNMPCIIFDTWDTRGLFCYQHIEKFALLRMGHNSFSKYMYVFFYFCLCKTDVSTIVSLNICISCCMERTT